MLNRALVFGCLFLPLLGGLVLPACASHTAPAASVTTPAPRAATRTRRRVRRPATPYGRCVRRHNWDACFTVAVPRQSAHTPTQRTEARDALDRGCAQGEGRACYQHSRLSITDLSDAAARESVRARLDLACGREDMDACALLGMLQRSGALGASDDSAARERCTRACERGSAHGCLCLAGLDLARAHGEDEITRARALYDRACASGSTLACATSRGLAEAERAVDDLARPTDANGSSRRSLTPDTMREAVRPHLDTDVRECFEQTLSLTPFARGEVVVQLVIGPEGRVWGAHTDTNTSGFPLAETGDCIAARVRTWRFPAPAYGATVAVNYPFTLSPE